MAKKYLSKDGKRISKTEFERREKISKALKKSWKIKKEEQDFYNLFLKEAGLNVESKSSSKKSIPRKSKTTTKRNPTKSKKSKTKSKPRKSGSNTKSVNARKFTKTRKKVKVKTFPKNKDAKKNNKNFFFSDKQSFNLKRKIRLYTFEDVKKVKGFINQLRPDLFDFYKKSKGKKRKKLMNLGYKIRLEFRSQDGKDKTVIDSTSFTKSFLVSKQANIDNNIDGLMINIEERFNDYMKRNGFYSLAFGGVQAEMEN
jgi:hypothetical protein